MCVTNTDINGQTKHKGPYFLIAAFFLAIFLIWYIPKQTWRVKSQDGYGNAGKAIGVGMTTWESIYDGVTVDESIFNYRTSTEAREDFQERLNDPSAVIESEKRPDNSSKTGRAVLIFNAVKTKPGTTQIIKLSGNQIQSISAPSLKSALAFEKAWLKIGF